MVQYHEIFDLQFCLSFIFVYPQPTPIFLPFLSNQWLRSVLVSSESNYYTHSVKTEQKSKILQSIGQWPMLVRMMEQNGGRKSRWTVPLTKQKIIQLLVKAKAPYHCKQQGLVWHFAAWLCVGWYFSRAWHDWNMDSCTITLCGQCTYTV